MTLGSDIDDRSPIYCDPSGSQLTSKVLMIGPSGPAGCSVNCELWMTVEQLGT